MSITATMDYKWPPPPSLLTTYNGLRDPHLNSYFAKEVHKNQIKKSGLLNKRGQIITYTVYRSNERREVHKEKVKEILAEAVVRKVKEEEGILGWQERTKREAEAKFDITRRVKASRPPRPGITPYVPSLKWSPCPPTPRRGKAGAWLSGSGTPHRPSPRPATAMAVTAEEEAQMLSARQQLVRSAHLCERLPCSGAPYTFPWPEDVPSPRQQPPAFIPPPPRRSLTAYYINATPRDKPRYDGKHIYSRYVLKKDDEPKDKKAKVNVNSNRSDNSKKKNVKGEDEDKVKDDTPIDVNQESNIDEIKDEKNANQNSDEAIEETKQDVENKNEKENEKNENEKEKDEVCSNGSDSNKDAVDGEENGKIETDQVKETTGQTSDDKDQTSISDVKEETVENKTDAESVEQSTEE